MDKDYLDINETTKLCTLDYDVKFVIKINGYYYIKLENEQSFITDGKKVYDTSFYGDVRDIFLMGESLYAVCKAYSVELVNLDTKKIIFSDETVSNIYRVDDQVVCVIRHGIKTLYNICSKEFLNEDNKYGYEYSLGNGFYSFVEKDSEKKGYELKRFVINSKGDIIFDNIEGYPHIETNHLIINQGDTLRVLTFSSNQSYFENVFEKGENILVKPLYVNGQIILVEKGFVRFYSLDNELLKEVKIDGLEYIYDSQYVNGILKLCVAESREKDASTRHVFLNINSGNVISHFRIKEYPYWTPNCFVGFETYNDVYKRFEEGNSYDASHFHFYGKDFNKFADIKGNIMKELDLSALFLIKTWNGEGFDQVFVNGFSQIVKPCMYDSIYFEDQAAAGYAINNSEDKMDVVDMNLNVLVDHVDLKVEFGAYHIWNAFLVNGYVALILAYYGVSNSYRTILFNPDGEVIKETSYKAFPMDNTMQLFGPIGSKSLFLNTKTGEIKPLTITAKADPVTRLIDFDAINNIKGLLPDNEMLKFNSQDKAKEKVKNIQS